MDNVEPDIILDPYMERSLSAQREELLTQQKLNKVEKLLAQKLQVMLGSNITNGIGDFVSNHKYETAVFVAWLMLKKSQLDDDFHYSIFPFFNHINDITNRENSYLGNSVVSNQGLTDISNQINNRVAISEYGNVYSMYSMYNSFRGSYERFVGYAKSNIIVARMAETQAAFMENVNKLVDRAVNEMKQFTELTRKEAADILKKLSESELAIAKRIAKTQVGRTYSTLRELAARSAGYTDYVWCTQLDDRVRDLHKSLEGTSQNLNNPPISGPGGETGNPGEPINCRCYARFIKS